MGLDYAPHHKKRVNRRKIRRGVVERLLVWFEYPVVQAGVGPFITLSSLVAALAAINVTTDHFETDALTKLLSEDRAKYEDSLNTIQTNIEGRIPDRVRSPLPIFPQNDQTLLLGPKGKEKTIELEWADRDRKHRHRYLVQLVCIAEIQPEGASGKPSENSETKHDTELRCRTDKLDADTPAGKELDRKTFHWTQRGVDSVKVPIKHAGTYAWRVARAKKNDNEERNNNEEVTVFEEWSPYYIFTVFESIEQRFKTINKVLVGTVEGSALLKKEEEEDKEKKDRASKEKELVKSIRENQFKNMPEHYLSYPTYEALIDAVGRGEVDYAIGEITRAKYREERGIFFTQGYNDALPIFVSKSNRIRPPRDGDTIGVVLGSISERALLHLGKSKKFATVKELTLDALEDDLKSGSVDFIFTERLTSSPASTGQEKFVPVGTLYNELKDFYDDQLGYRARHAIATADEELCKGLDKLVKVDYENRSFMERFNAIYSGEAGSFFNFSFFHRFVDEFFHGDERPCDKS